MIDYSVSWNAMTPPADTPRSDDPLAAATAALAARPHQALASHALGVRLIEAGLGLTAMPFLLRAVLLQPISADFVTARLFGLLQSGRFDDALDFIAECETRALPPALLARWRAWTLACQSGTDPATLDLPAPARIERLNEPPDRAPDWPTATAPQAQLGAVFAQALRDHRAGRLSELAATLAAPLALHPDWGEGWHLLGLARLGLGDAAAAVTALTTASRLLPGRPEVWDHLGVARMQAGDHAGAAVTFEQALARHPLRPETWNNAAQAALEARDWPAAWQYALQAVQLKPGQGTTIAILLRAAHALEREAGERGEGGEKAPVGPLALSIQVAAAGIEHPEQVLALCARLAVLERRREAVTLLEEMLTRFAGHPAAPALLGELVFNQRLLCDWRHHEERLPALIKHLRASDQALVDPFIALTLPGLGPDDLLRVARRHAARFQAWSARAAELPPPARAPEPDQRLRIGYLSADFHEHATSYLAAGLFERHDRARFEVFAYSIGPDSAGPMRRRLQAAFEQFVDLRPLPALEAARRIRADGIDILVDLKGYTAGARPEILALRPAPIQVNWLGFPGTLGAPFVDYLIADPVVAPPRLAEHYDETLAWLPHAYVPVDDRRAVAAPPTRASASLPEEALVLCCFNNPYKIGPEMFDCWCDLLREIPDAVLWLFARDDSVPDNLTREAGQRGIAPERLIFAPRLPQPEHLARLALADLMLDTLPCNAHTTASDALWMGVPVLTCPGETFAGRVAASLLTAAGLPELVVASLDDYRALARRLAARSDERAALRERLAAARTTAPFFDTAGFARDLEALYRRMWERHAQGLAPAPLPPETRHGVASG